MWWTYELWKTRPALLGTSETCGVRGARSRHAGGSLLTSTICCHCLHWRRARFLEAPKRMDICVQPLSGRRAFWRLHTRAKHACGPWHLLRQTSASDIFQCHVVRPCGLGAAHLAGFAGAGDPAVCISVDLALATQRHAACGLHGPLYPVGTLVPCCNLALRETLRVVRLPPPQASPVRVTWRVKRCEHHQHGGRRCKRSARMPRHTAKRCRQARPHRANA